MIPLIPNRMTESRLRYHYDELFLSSILKHALGEGHLDYGLHTDQDKLNNSPNILNIDMDDNFSNVNPKIIHKSNTQL